MKRIFAVAGVILGLAVFGSVVRPAMLVVVAVLLASAAWASTFPSAAYAGALVSGSGVSQLTEAWSGLVVKIKKKKKNQDGDEAQEWCCRALFDNGSKSEPICGAKSKTEGEAGVRDYYINGFHRTDLKTVKCQKAK